MSLEWISWYKLKLCGSVPTVGKLEKNAHLLPDLHKKKLRIKFFNWEKHRRESIILKKPLLFCPLGCTTSHCNVIVSQQTFYQDIKKSITKD